MYKLNGNYLKLLFKNPAVCGYLKLVIDKNVQYRFNILLKNYQSLIILDTKCVIFYIFFNLYSSSKTTYPFLKRIFCSLIQLCKKIIFLKTEEEL